MQKIYITCGLVGSGKSTWAKSIAIKEKNTVIVCRDDIRTMLKKEYIYDKDIEGLVKHITCQIIVSSLMRGYDIIIDETNIKKDTRKLWLNVTAFPKIIETSIMLFPESKNNLENRMKDPRGYSRDKWEKVIEGMKNSFECPTIDEDPRINSITKVELINNEYKYTKMA